MAKIDPAGIENSIRLHGLLLEHETQRAVEDALAAVDCRIKHSAISDVIRAPSSEYGTIEIDVFIKTAPFGVDALDFIYSTPDGAEWIDPIHQANIETFYVTQCKGHDREGFLLARSIGKFEKPALPLLLHPQNKRSTGSIGTPHWSASPVYRSTSDVSFGVPFMIDWAYFYTRDKNSLSTGQKAKPDEPFAYKQDKDGSSNKFIRAVEQVNGALEAVLATKAAPFNPATVQHFVPMIVTNAEIIVVDIDSRTGVAELSDSVPWAIYTNPLGLQFDHTAIKGFGLIYVVNSDHISEFIAAHRSALTRMPNVIPSTVPAQFHKFRYRG